MYSAQFSDAGFQHNPGADCSGAVASLNGCPTGNCGTDPNLPLVKPVTMEQQIASTLQRERLFAWLCGAFAVLALAPCMIGLYGVMSYAIARRTQEIGIRMALGASPVIVLWHVLGEGLAVALAGCAMGVPIPGGQHKDMSIIRSWGWTPWSVR